MHAQVGVRNAGTTVTASNAHSAHRMQPFWLFSFAGLVVQTYFCRLSNVFRDGGLCKHVEHAQAQRVTQHRRFYSLVALFLVPVQTLAAVSTVSTTPHMTFAVPVVPCSVGLPRTCG